jgi:tetratricopeptide (TPR) repeat protein
MLASMESAQGDTNACRTDLKNAISASNDRPEDLVPVAQLAFELGAADLAMDAYVRTLSFTPFARTAAKRIITLGQLADNSDALIKACERILSFDPDDLEALNELAYTLFVQKRRDAKVEAMLVNAAGKTNAPAGLLVTEALLKLCSGAPSEALDLLEKRPIDWAKAPNRWKMVYAAALGANKQNEAARRIARELRADQLRAAERSWVESWL